VLHSVPGQYQLADHIRSSLKKAGKDVSIFWLDYTLAPEKHYPTQLAQAIEILKYALSTGRKPSDIMIGGDSAGGNLTVAVLSHLMHPHPDSSVERLELEGPLRGAVLISPWVSFDTSFPSCTTNLQKDYCPPGAVKRFGATWRGDAPQDNYNEPFVAPKEWWTDLPAKVQDILITIGGLELAADSITGFAGKVEENHKGTTTVVLRNEYHVAPAIDTFIGIRRESETSKAIVSWLIERF
jgi:acetyl esterase/lipase